MNGVTRPVASWTRRIFDGSRSNLRDDYSSTRVSKFARANTFFGVKLALRCATFLGVVSRDLLRHKCYSLRSSGESNEQSTHRFGSSCEDCSEDSPQSTVRDA